MDLDYGGLGRQIDSMIRLSVLRNLEDLESSVEGVVEIITEALNVEKPRVIATVNEVNECGRFDTGLCSTVMGLYVANNPTIIINYRANLTTLLHLLAHHLQALEVGRDRYVQVRDAEELRLPWDVRPLEVNAMIRSIRLTKGIPQRVFKVWNEEVRPMSRGIEETVNRVRALVAHLSKGVESTMVNNRAY